jgi:hypothetical protein
MRSGRFAGLWIEVAKNIADVIHEGLGLDRGEDDRGDRVAVDALGKFDADPPGGVVDGPVEDAFRVVRVGSKKHDTPRD